MFNEFPSLFPSLWRGVTASSQLELQRLSWCLSIFVIVCLSDPECTITTSITYHLQECPVRAALPSLSHQIEQNQKKYEKQTSWMYCLACCFEELVFVWDVQCYNVNTGDVDDLLFENLDWGIYAIKGTWSLTVSSNQRPKKKKKKKREFFKATPKATG